MYFSAGSIPTIEWYYETGNMEAGAQIALAVIDNPKHGRYSLRLDNKN